ncbi:hypothetical protein PINS_up022971 [Pythium insidiosum]|nr:hypothetical protein PINS_up022971 [Pythium insidiosum]
MRELLTDEQWRSVIQTSSGLGAGAISTALLYPLDLVKVRYQVHEKSAKAYQSLSHAFRTIVAEEGMRSLFRGMSPALYGSTLSWGLYMLLYQNAKQRYARMADDGWIQGSWQYFFSAMEAGIVCVPITNPIWLIKVRMQVQSRVEMHHTVGTKDAAAKLAQERPVSQCDRCIPTDCRGRRCWSSVQRNDPSVLPYHARRFQVCRLRVLEGHVPEALPC